MTMSIDNLEGFAALDPFFRIIREGLTGLADGEHYFGLLSEDVIVEYVVSVPGYPRRVEGRQAVANLYRSYGDMMLLHTVDELAVHRDPETSVVVLEYAVHGQAVRTGRDYDNHFVSVVTIKDRQVTHWRDYMDPVAVPSPRMACGASLSPPPIHRRSTAWCRGPACGWGAGSDQPPCATACRSRAAGAGRERHAAGERGRAATTGPRR
ncbi:hypothetical protein ABZ357_25820 [Streptomyces sp. NPDC005917]|uniref:nuclear transport factor 2 family protein n=1 Tax=unclassified Streptomyces TaxID=2593676 RepID=UPI0033C6EEA3